MIAINVKIKEIPVNDRPRERLINNGVQSLSNEEVLSIILKTGTKGNSVKNLSMDILSYVKNLNNLKNITFQELMNIKGIGKAQACTILALAEMSKRMNQRVLSLVDTKLDSPEVVFEFYKNKINSSQEHVYCVYLNAGKRVIKEKLLFIGTVNYSLIHPRDVFKEAYLLNASSIICVHNHPSGNVNPSSDDKNMTIRLREIGVLMGINLLDHIIISETNYYSFLENGKI
jgi:DNA repair protein RadC